MKNEKIFLLFLLILIVASCQTQTARQIAEYIGRPNFPDPCIANGDGTCYRNGELEDNTNNICGDVSEYDLIQDHLENTEYRLYICLKFPKRCK